MNQSHKIQYPIDFKDPEWPDQERFPLNISIHNRKVGQILEQDLQESNECIIITGFTSLTKLIEWFGTDKFKKLKDIRILLGNDPILRKKNKYPFNFIDLDIKEYWLNKGISLYLGSSVLNLIQKLENGNIKFKFKKRLHAKIYVSDEYAILGSSNFSRSGLEHQTEANIRESQSGSYTDIKQIANLIYNDHSSKDYERELISLLKELLSDVTWQEALARAIAEVLEGRWFSSNNEFFGNLENKNFWPSQYDGLMEAINILIDKGNVLIADPTGSGKTKMCSAIIISFIYWLWQTGNKSASNLLLICPPIVKSNWEREFRDLNFLNYTLRSLGILSNTTDDNLKDILKELELSNVLAIDEAHNLLNPISIRSKRLASNSAEYKILITATPVNKKLEDLIRIIELLDVDNLDDSDFEHYKEIKESKVKTVSQEGRERLKGFIDNFLVRRTKSELNQLIVKDPDKYKNRIGKKCRFPDVENPVYNTLETENDKKIVEQISLISGELKGLNYLTKFEPQDFLVNSEEDKIKYINQRLEGAKNLAIYNIRASLRSSKVALLEYLIGTKKVNNEYKLDSNKNPTGNVIKNIKDLSGVLPTKNFGSPHFPKWLEDIDKYREACAKEVELYEKIYELAQDLSTNREEGKVEEIRKLIKDHRIVLAFDSKLITLDFLNKLLRQQSNDIKCLVATGTNKATVERVLRICAPGSTAKSTVILCSDIMSEGVNLQSASALVLLDMPSVIRLVEQRIGRIDRMDTDYEQIKVLWPNDSEQFSLKGDKRLVNTSIFVNSTLGGNFNIPSILREKHFENVDDVESIKRELEEKKGEKGWEGSHNFFKPIQDLRNRFISNDLYELFKDVGTQVRTRVSFYDSTNDWCFICTRGNLRESPKWLFLEKKSKPFTNFIDVSEKLNTYLPLIDDSRLPWNQEALNSFLKEFRNYERLLLPVKKRRVLDVAMHILEKKLTLKNRKREYYLLIRQNLGLFLPSIKDEITDFHSLADLWLNILQPILDTKKNQRKNRRKAINLNDLKKDWKSIKIEEPLLEMILRDCSKVESIDNRIAACIVGVKTIKA